MGGGDNVVVGDRGSSKQRGRSSPRTVEELVQRVDMSARRSCGQIRARGREELESAAPSSPWSAEAHEDA